MLLVTGATGRLARAILPRIVSTLDGPICLVVRDVVRARSVLPVPVVAHATLLEADLPDQVPFVKARYVLHMAATTRGAPSRHREVNEEGTARMVDMARRAEVEHFIHLGTDIPPTSPYGISKARSEAIVRASGLPFTAIRPAQVWGPTLSAWQAMERLARARGLPVPLDLVLRPLFQDDLADVLVACLATGARGDTLSLAGEPVTLGAILSQMGTGDRISLPRSWFEGAASLVGLLPLAPSPALSVLGPRAALEPGEIPRLGVSTTPFSRVLEACRKPS